MISSLLIDTRKKQISYSRFGLRQTERFDVQSTDVQDRRRVLFECPFDRGSRRLYSLIAVEYPGGGSPSASRDVLSARKGKSGENRCRCGCARKQRDCPIWDPTQQQPRLEKEMEYLLARRPPGKQLVWEKKSDSETRFFGLFFREEERSILHIGDSVPAVIGGCWITISYILFRDVELSIASSRGLGYYIYL